MIVHVTSELIYGGFWEHEHHSVDPVHTRHDDAEKEQRNVFRGRSKRHSFAITLMFLSRGRGDFKDLVQCLEGLTGQWAGHTDGEEGEGKMRPLLFMKHLYYEVCYLDTDVGCRGWGQVRGVGHSDS